MTEEEFKTLKVGDKVVFHKKLCDKSKYEQCTMFSSKLVDSKVYTIDVLMPHHKSTFNIEVIRVIGDNYFHPIDVFTIYKEEFVLPEKWYCPYSNMVEFDIMNKFFQGHWGYVAPGGNYGCNNNSNTNHWNTLYEKYGERITFEQFKKYVMKEKEFVLPEKWCVKHYQSVAEYIIKLQGSNWGNYYEDLTLYSHFPKVEDLHCYNTPQPGYTEITIEEFNKYVLNNKKEEMKKKTFKVGDVVLINTVSEKSINAKGKGVVLAIDPKGWAYVAPGFNHKVDKTPRWEKLENLSLSSIEIDDWMVIDNLDNKFNGKIGHVGKVVDTEYGMRAPYKLEPHCTGTSWDKSNLRFASEDEIPKEPQEYTFKFDDMNIIVKKKGIYVESDNWVTIEELEAVINYFKNPPSICGYKVGIYDNNTDVNVDLNSSDYLVSFGCQCDRFDILLEVRDAYYKLNK